MNAYECVSGPCDGVYVTAYTTDPDRVNVGNVAVVSTRSLPVLPHAGPSR
jgi:hypothetical protein